MKKDKKLYIAAVGMITAIGANAEMTIAAVNAGVSGYMLSDYESRSGAPLKMALIDNAIIDNIQVETPLHVAEGDRYNMRHDRITIMANIALQQLCKQAKSTQAVPFIMAKSEYNYDHHNLSSLTDNLVDNMAPWIKSELSRSFYSGRAAAIEAIDMIFNYLYDSGHDYFIVGGSDSPCDHSLLEKLDCDGRLLCSDNSDGFASGEGAGYLLLTTRPELAQVKNGTIIALNPPGIAEEKGHIYSEFPYRGDGLDKAFKNALTNNKQQTISAIYSSMNGERFWAKELAVAQLRNKKYFTEDVHVEHPAEFFGDLGAATASILIALAAENLWQNKTAQSHLVYSSSDSAKRAVVVLEKMPAVNPVLGSI